VEFRIRIRVTAVVGSKLKQLVSRVWMVGTTEVSPNPDDENE